MASFSQVVELLGKVALQMLPGIMLGGGNFSRAIEKAAAKKGMKGAAMTYPGLTHDFIYPIISFPATNAWANNTTLNRSLASKGALAQSLEEHNSALMNGGEAGEKALQSWWPGEDDKPRVAFTPSSTAVQGVKILPNNKIQIQFRGGGKWYTYKGGHNVRETSEFVKDLLTEPSIGRALPRNGKIAHAFPGDKNGRIDNNVGWWGRDHYDPNW